MKQAFFVASIAAAIFTMGFAVQAHITGAVISAWCAVVLFCLAFRPAGASGDGRLRFTLSDICWLITLIALSLGILSNQQQLAQWITGSTIERDVAR